MEVLNYIAAYGGGLLIGTFIFWLAIEYLTEVKGMPFTNGKTGLIALVIDILAIVILISVIGAFTYVLNIFEYFGFLLLFVGVFIAIITMRLC